MRTIKESNLSRRSFLFRSVSGLASIGLLNVPGKKLLGQNDEKTPLDLKKKVIFRALGKTDIQLPIVNMGILNVSSPELIIKSYEIGVRLFDTAHTYHLGQSEKMLGNTVKELNARDKVIISTKVAIPDPRQKLTPTQARNVFITMAEESLKRLKTDYIDILCIHDVRNAEDLKNPSIQEALFFLKEQKKARLIGFSIHANMTECINEASKMDFYDVILTAYNYAMSDDTSLSEAVMNAAAKRIGIIAMKTQCSLENWSYRQYVPRAKQKYYGSNIMHTAVLKWVLRNDNIATAIPGFSNYQQMEEDFSVAYDLEYTPEEKLFLEDRNVKLAMGYCHQCYKCVPTCLKEVDIPTLMRTYMYAACYTNFYQARDALNSIPKGKDISVCRSCKTCKAVCVNRIDIGKRIDELKAIFT